MKVYLLILLLFGACVKDNKQNISDSSLDQTTNEIEIEEPIIARYGIEPELFWLDESGTSCEPLAEDVNYSAIYYEPISNNYYTAEIGYIYPIGNPILYDTNNIKDEKNYYDFEKTSFPKLPLRYVGSIDLTNRVYLTTNNMLYVKKLKLLEDKEYYIFTNAYPLEENTLYPFVSNSMVEGYSQNNMIYYSNSIQIFIRIFPPGSLEFFENIKTQ